MANTVSSFMFRTHFRIMYIHIDLKLAYTYINVYIRSYVYTYINVYVHVHIYMHSYVYKQTSSEGGKRVGIKIITQFFHSVPQMLQC